MHFIHASAVTIRFQIETINYCVCAAVMIMSFKVIEIEIKNVVTAAITRFKLQVAFLDFEVKFCLKSSTFWGRILASKVLSICFVRLDLSDNKCKSPVWSSDCQQSSFPLTAVTLNDRNYCIFCRIRTTILVASV